MKKRIAAFLTAMLLVIGLGAMSVQAKAEETEGNGPKFLFNVSDWNKFSEGEDYEHTEPPKPTIPPTSEPSTPTSEPSTPTSEPSTPTSEPSTPTSEPPTSEPPTPTSEPPTSEPPTSEPIGYYEEDPKPKPAPRPETAPETEAASETGEPTETVEIFIPQVPEEEPGTPLWGYLVGGLVALLLAALVVLLLRKTRQLQGMVAPVGIPLQLIIVSGVCKDPKEVYYLNKELLIGSDPACDIVWKDSSVSPKHCRVYVSNGLLLIEDLNKQSRTAVEGLKIHAPNRLRSEDEVAIGRVRFKFLF